MEQVCVSEDGTNIMKTNSETENVCTEENIEINDDFVKESGYYDLTLNVGNHKIHVSKAVLGIASPVFRAMFESDFKEKDKSEVELPGNNFKDFVEFLKCVYPDKINHVTGETVHGILPLASEYQIQTLKDRCEKILEALVKFKHRTDAECVFRHIYLSELYQLEELTRAVT